VDPRERPAEDFGMRLNSRIKKEKNKMMNIMKRLWKEEEGQDLLEYVCTENNRDVDHLFGDGRK